MKFGAYEVERELGKGGMGAAYLARDTRSGARVVVKTVRWPSTDLLLRFEREGRIGQKLRHSGIVATLDVGRDESGPYIVLEHVEGGTLRDLIDRGPLEPRRAAALARDVAIALEHAHREGVVHRDLKPENILIDGRGRPRIADFGLSRASSDARMSATGEVLGTPAYTPPEQLRAGAGAHAAAGDIWALGVLLHEMLAGSVPWSAGTPLALMKAILETPPPALPPSVPRPLALVARRCLEKDPGARYARAREVADALEAALERRRGGRSLAVAGLAVAALALGAGVLVTRRSPPRPPAPPPPPRVVPGPDAAALLREAEDAFHANRFRTAHALAERALALDASSTRATNVRIFSDMALPRSADFRRSDLRLPPGHPVERLLMALDAGEAIDPADFVPLAPWQIGFVRGIEQLNRGDLVAAAETERLAYGEAPWCAAPLLIRGFALTRLVNALIAAGRSPEALDPAKEALASFAAAIRLGPELALEPAVRYERGVMQLRLGDNEAARADLDVAAVGSGTTQAFARFTRATLFEDQEKWALARDDFLACARIATPATPGGVLVASWRRAADCDRKLGDMDAALEHAENGLRVDPVDGYALLACLDVLRAHPRRTEIAARARAALDASPDDRLALSVLACALEATGRKAEALAAWEKIQAGLLPAKNKFIDEHVAACR
ncbi:MAG TPA: protein kinase [Planctomycetota bacterium]|nr:protein kinase [Planctomycetota bacterium]